MSGAASKTDVSGPCAHVTFRLGSTGGMLQAGQALARARKLARIPSSATLLSGARLNAMKERQIQFCKH
jgi:hypothetical protein